MTRPRLIDLTRSLRRAGRVATGVDRVERAYLARFLAEEHSVLGLVRTPFGYLLIDRAGLSHFQSQLNGAAPWGQAGLLSRLVRGRTDSVKRAESGLRRAALVRTRPRGLAAALSRQMPGGFDYFNLGHSNLTDRVLDAVTHAGGHVHVMVHDVIPLTHPQFQRVGTVAPFEAKLRRVAKHATRAIYNSNDTRTQTELYFKEWGRVPVGIVAHLGTIEPAAKPDELPEGTLPKAPYFVVVGTIEPRKNHAFLLDVWNKMGPNAPPLLICGSRGWNNDAVFARLDALTCSSKVRELANLSDGAIAALVQNSAGSLFPSFAEGYGLPPVEALTLGARVLCNDLPILREILGEKAIYAPVTDTYLWIDTIQEWLQKPQASPDASKYSGPKWDDHFKTVLR